MDLGHVPLIAWLVLASFVSSAVWLIKNWNAKGPTDLWKDEDIVPPRVRRHGSAVPSRDDPHGRNPLVLIGYWRSEGEPDWPDARRFVDPNWDPDERAMVIAHVERGATPWAAEGRSTCRFCDTRPSRNR